MIGVAQDNWHSWELQRTGFERAWVCLIAEGLGYPLVN